MPPRRPGLPLTTLSLLLILAFGFFLRLKAADHDYISQWDEAYHALVAKHLSLHPLRPTLYEEPLLPYSYKDWTRAHIWLHKPPLPLWIMALSITAFGDRELALRIPSVVLDTAAILLIFLIADALFGRKGRLAGLFAAASYSLNPLMIRLASGRIPDDHPHLINVFFIILTVWLCISACERTSWIRAACAGIAAGLGTLCLSMVGALGLAASLPLFAAARPQGARLRLLLAAVGACFLTAVPWPLYCLRRWPAEYRWETSLQLQHLFLPLEGHAHPAGWFLRLLPLHYGGWPFLVYASLGISLTYAVWTAARDRDAGLWTALLWALLPYAFFSAIQTKLYSYVCVAVPALSLILGYGAASLWSAREYCWPSNRNRRLGRTALAAAMLAWGVQTAKVASERLAADYRLFPMGGLYDYPLFRKAMLGIRSVEGPKAIFNVGDSKSVQAMYYAECPAYPAAPSVEEARRLIGQGYRIFVVLDEEHGDAQALGTLRSAGLLERIDLVRLPKPKKVLWAHPYEARSGAKAPAGFS